MMTGQSQWTLDSKAVSMDSGQQQSESGQLQSAGKQTGEKGLRVLPE